MSIVDEDTDEVVDSVVKVVFDDEFIDDAVFDNNVEVLVVPLLVAFVLGPSSSLSSSSRSSSACLLLTPSLMESSTIVTYPVYLFSLFPVSCSIGYFWPWMISWLVP